MANLDRESLDAEYWSDLLEATPVAGITLDPTINYADFAIYGDRLADRQVNMVRTLCADSFDPGKATLLDIGCGMGRLTKPFADQFSKVVGVDINSRILDEARTYCQGKPNVEFFLSDGQRLPFSDAVYDHAYCGGVLQHVTDVSTITGYFREGLRVLRVGGILNFGIQTWHTAAHTGPNTVRIGAKVTAAHIEQILWEESCELVALVEDPDDPVPHFNIILRKTNAPSPVPFILSEEDVIPMPIRSGIFEDLPSYKNLRMRWNEKDGTQPVTFWDRYHIS